MKTMQGLAAVRGLTWRLVLAFGLALGLTFCASQVAAQTIESLEWVDGPTARVARITFAANVRFLRQAPGQTTLTDLAQLGFQIVSAEEAVLAQSVEEGKRLGGEVGQPRIELTYVPVATAQTKLLTLRFAEKLLLQVRQGPGARSIDLVLGKAAPGSSGEAPLPATPQVETKVVDVDGQGEQLLEKARQALSARRFQDAVDASNQALMLPPNPFTPAAQELIGLAWEALGKPDKARTEYQLYQKLYPEGEALARVNQRLAALGAASAVAKASPKDSKNRLSATGSVSQYFYGGQTKTDSLVNIATGVDQNTLTKTNQSVLVSSWDATGRYETEESISKLVMRGSRSDNLGSASALSSTTQGLISAAYVDYRDLKSRMDFRFGRQSAIGGSLFGLFDGVSMAMPIAENYKLDAMLGVPANTLVNAPQQTMVGVMLEADNLFEHWGGNVSLVEQTTEGISDRRAVGMELRYFGDTLSMYTQLDYDINFNEINALTLQGSFQGPMDSTVTMLLDDRKAPSLQLSDALISSGKPSLSTLLQTMSLNDAQRLALATAAQARQAMVSVSRALSSQWQGSMDLRYSEVGALPAVGNFQAQPATGAQYSTSFQLTGSNLYSSRDINGFNASFISSDTMNGMQLAYNNLTGFMDNKMSLEPSIRYYTQTDNTQTKISRISPGLRLSYKLSSHANLMAEGIYESAQTDGLTNHETSESIFFYVGYRYDFQ